MAAQIANYLIPLLDEANHLMSVTCQYCGATIGPLPVSDDNEVVLQMKIPHQPTCTLSLIGQGFVRMH